MRLYLSSFRVGAHADELLRMVGAGRRAALVPNAIDDVASRNPGTVITFGVPLVSPALSTGEPLRCFVPT